MTIRHAMRNRPQHLLFVLLATVGFTSLAAQAPVSGLRDGEARDPQVAIAPTQGQRAELIALADGSLRVEAPSYVASFRGATAALEMRANETAAEPARLSLRLAGWSRGSDMRKPGKGAVATNLGARVLIDHGDVVEGYHVRDSALEQSFRFDRRPAGSGDLQLHIDVFGNVTSDPIAPVHRAIEFRHAGAPAIRYGEAFALDRGGRKLRLVTGYDGNGRITLTVPAAFVDSAHYPLLVDPAVGPVFLPGGSVYEDQSPDAAHDPDARRYLIVWERAFSGSDVQIRGRIHDNNGNAVSPLIAITTSGINRHPSVTWLRDEHAYQVVWELGGRIRSKTIDDVTGATIHAGYWVSTPPLGVWDHRPDIANIGARASIIVWDRTDANLNEPNRIVGKRARWWYGGVSGSYDHEFHLISGNTGYVRSPRLPQSGLPVPNTTDEYDLMVVWERFYTYPAPGDTDVLFTAFRSHATTSQVQAISPHTGPTNVAGASDVGVDEITPSVALMKFSGSRHALIAWDDDGDILASRYGTNGLLLGSPFAIRSTSAIQSMPAVGGGWCDFTVGYAEADPATPFRKNIRAARVKWDGTVAIADRPVDILNGPNQGGLRAASPPFNGSSQDRTSTTLLVWWGETGSGSGVRDVRARFFEPVAPSLWPYGTACAGPGGTLPQIGTANGQPIPGNDTFRFTVANAPPNSIAFLMTSATLTTTPIPGAPGCDLYIGLPLISATPAFVNGSGFGSLIVSIPYCVPSGSLLGFQWAVFAPGWNPIGLVVSDDLDVSWSH